MFLRKLETSENGGQKLSNMSPMLLIDALPLTSGATCSQDIRDELLGPAARDRAKKQSRMLTSS